MKRVRHQSENQGNRSQGNRTQGFTLVEVLIAVAMGAAVVGAGMLVYLQGNRMFFTTSEHASFRQEAMVVLEHVSRDLEQLMVSNEQWGGGGEYYLVEPFKLTHEYIQQITDPEDPTRTLDYAEAGSGVVFFRYHHTEMVPDPQLGSKPKLVARKIEYSVEPVDTSKPELGVNLLRNGKRVNTIALSEVIFQKVPPAVAFNQVQGSANAILKVTVIPQGGLFRAMRADAIENLKKDGTVLSKVFHLSGYESQYTANLFRAQQKVTNNGGNPSVLSSFPVLQAVYNDAAQQNGGAPLASIQDAVDDGPAQGYVAPDNLVTIEEDLFENPTGPEAASDPEFAGPANDDVFGDGDKDVGEIPPTITDEFSGSPGGSTEEQPNHCPAVPSHGS